jgi:dihydrofolate synthase / folylpolyglutamate synthase
MDYSDALAWLYRRQRFGVKLGLETMEALLDRLGHPEQSFGTLHVTGSNGKGSVCAFLESCLRAAGHRVGLYTSPHLVSFRERIRVGGEPIAPEDVAAGVERLRPLVDDLDARRTSPTFFECVTALAFDHFRRQRVPLAVVEVGLGGRLDATNLCRPIVSVITNVGLEHTDRLGTSIQMIAGEKAGILREGVPAITGARREALDVLAREAGKRKSPLKVVRAPDPVEATLEATRFRFAYAGAVQAFESRLLGEHQAENACFALAALEAQKAVAVPVEAAARGVAAAEWPGRLEVVDRDPLTLLDGAHNAPAFEALTGFLAKHAPNGDAAACVAILREKAASKMLRILSPYVKRLVLTEAPNDRTLSARELESLLPSDAPPHVAIANPHEAIRALFQGGQERLRLVTGSLFLVGEARAQILRIERDPPVNVPVSQ